MADENKSPQIENTAKITLEELAYMVKQMRHNQGGANGTQRRKRLQPGRHGNKKLTALLPS